MHCCGGSKIVTCVAGLVSALIATGIAADAQTNASGTSAAERCFMLALGPAVGDGPSRVKIPSIIALRRGGQIRGAIKATDTLMSRGDEPVGEWVIRHADSLEIAWHPFWLGGLLELRLHREGSNLRGRYALHGHQADDGRDVPRGSASALAITCVHGRVSDVAELGAARRLLTDWRAAQRPDTSLAHAETRIAFAAALRADPVHSISLMNYRIAEFACRTGRPPNSLAELRAARTADIADPDVDWLGEALWSDAWHRPIQYRRRGLGYEVRSAGSDGRLGTADDLVGRYDTIPLKRFRKDGCR